MRDADGANLKYDDLRRRAQDNWAQDRPVAAFDAAWAAFDLAPSESSTRRLLARLLESYPAELQPARRADYLRLLTDREIEPDLISSAGWQLLQRVQTLPKEASDIDFTALASTLKRDELALTLLREAPVYFASAERLVTRLRRWLLLSGQWRQHPEILAALKMQMRLNGGAWPYDEDEGGHLAKVENRSLTTAYLPIREERKSTNEANASNPVTEKVKAQYEGWPYPAWTRITVGEATRLPDIIRSMDPKIAEALPVEADMLIAGCGTGRQAAYVARRYPDAAITAIDVSEASLEYARRQCGVLGIANVRFRRLDLHDVAQLDHRFHAIHCGGVLHHLPSPERGFEVLAGVLHPAGVIHVMVYNRLQRMMIAAARTLIDDLMDQPVDDDLLRKVRQRILQQAEHPSASYVTRIRDFATLAGAHDLLLHRHEDPFDVTRVEKALDQAGLRMLSFNMSSPTVAARYDAMFPDDPKHKNVKAWARFARSDPNAIAEHFNFWGYKEHP
jgi:2-polyprenyl-3-methyl-5-hydroxy-6-metoxy-1,4-benzoquinol methylase